MSALPILGHADPHDSDQNPHWAQEEIAVVNINQMYLSMEPKKPNLSLYVDFAHACFNCVYRFAHCVHRVGIYRAFPHSLQVCRFVSIIDISHYRLVLEKLGALYMQSPLQNYPKMDEYIISYGKLRNPILLRHSL